MVKINDQNFTVYDLDTTQSVINRIAAEMKTLPKYLYFGFPISDIQEIRKTNVNIPVENILGVLTSDKASYDFAKVYSKIKDKAEELHLDFYEDLLVPFVVFNKSIGEASSEIRDVFILYLQEQVQKMPESSQRDYNIEEIWENREYTKQTITSAIDANIKATSSQKELFTKFKTIKNPISYTKFELQKVRFEFILDLLDISILEIFDRVKLNHGVPFASVNNMYKILKDFIPPEEWEIYLENAIIFKVQQRADAKIGKLSDYTDALLSVSDEGNITIGMSLFTSGNYLTREKLIERLVSTIQLDMTTEGSNSPLSLVKNIKESKVNGVFYFPKTTMNKVVFAALIMNNPLFSSLIFTIKYGVRPSITFFVYGNHPCHSKGFLLSPTVATSSY